MNYKTLGNTGVEVSEFSSGSLILGWLQADLTPEEGAPAIEKALELGVNFFDTAQSYRTEEHLRVGLGTRSADVVIASKTHERSREGAEKASSAATAPKSARSSPSGSSESGQRPCGLVIP